MIYEQYWATKSKLIWWIHDYSLPFRVDMYHMSPVEETSVEFEGNKQEIRWSYDGDLATSLIERPVDRYCVAYVHNWKNI